MVRFVVGRRIRSVNTDGTVGIHYTGWNGSFDETVTRSRLQLPSRQQRTVTMHLDRGWSITGRVIDVAPDAIVLSRAEDHKVCLVYKHQIRYAEIDNPSRQWLRG